MPLVKCPDCEKEISDAAPTCPGCGRPMASAAPAPPPPPPKAKLKKKVEQAGSGCLVQGLGILGGIALAVFVPVIGWIAGPLLAIICLVVGSDMATKWSCGHCGNPAADKNVRQCAACGAALSR